MSKVQNSNLEGWHRNTDLSVNLKTILYSDRKMKPCKDYQGVLRRDVTCEEFLYDEHFSFTETEPWSMKRNPHVFNGKIISVTRKDDGSYRLNFKPLKTGDGFKVERYALGVYNEICMALEGLIGER